MACNLSAAWCSALVNIICCIQSNHELYLLPKHSYSRQYSNISLQSLACSIYDLYWWLKHSFSIQHSKISFERAMLLYIYYVLIFCWDIRELWVEEEICLFPLCLGCLTLNPCSICLFTLHLILSLKCWSDSFLFASIGLGIEKEGRGGITRYIAYPFLFLYTFVFIFATFVNIIFLNS